VNQIAPASLLLDEMLSPRVAALLVERGIDCRAVANEPALVALDDINVLEVALSESRILVTNNVVHFEALQRCRDVEGKPVPGLIYTSDAGFPRNRQFVARIADALERAAFDHAVAMHGGILWLPGPNQIPATVRHRRSSRRRRPPN
jgi:hypothetical protein